jgi:hypothetical protein
MRKSVLAASALTAVLALPAAAAGTTGPFAGQVSQGRSNVHLFDNNPSNNACIQLATSYTISLTYAPASDVLTVSALGKTATGSGGSATLSVQSGWCTEFPITVTGTSVASSATYVLTVTRGSAIAGN